MGLTVLLSHSTYSMCGKYNSIFTTCTNRNKFDILMTGVADVRKGQVDMSYKGEHQTLRIQNNLQIQITLFCIELQIKSLAPSQGYIRWESH